MSIKQFLFSSLLVCVAVALTLRRLVTSALAEPVSDGGPHDAIGPYDAIDDYIKKEMRRLIIPGASLAIVEGDKIAHLRGFGHAHPGGAPPSPLTPFVIGSLTKSFTALATMQLVEAGKIDLDAPVQRYLPWFCVADPEASAHMTVRHLLNQTSGMPQLPGLLLLADFDDRPDASERQIRALSTLRLKRPVGAEFEYSNLHYITLGLIIEVASGERYAHYIENHIFSPLEMSHSYTTQAEAKKNGLAVGDRHWFSIPFAVSNLPIPRGALPGGELISSAQDMAHYLIAYLNEGHYKGVQIFSPSSIAELHRGVAEVIGMGDSVAKYGMGWFVTNIGKTRTIWHSGTVPDFSAFMALLPEQKKGIVLLLNADHYGFPPVMAELGLYATMLLAGQRPEPNPFGLIRVMPWAMRALLLIPLVQIVGVVATLLRLRNWRRDPQSRPSRGRTWGLHILLPLIPNLSLAALPVVLQVKGLLRYLMLFNPDISWIAIIGGGFAGIWTFARTALILRTIRKNST